MRAPQEGSSTLAAALIARGVGLFGHLDAIEQRFGFP